MKVTRVYIEAKKSHNFQTYTVGLDVDITHKEDDEEDLEMQILYIQAKCRKLCMAQIKLDK